MILILAQKLSLGYFAIHDIYDSIEEGGQAPKEIMEWTGW